MCAKAGFTSEKAIDKLMDLTTGPDHYLGLKSACEELGLNYEVTNRYWRNNLKLEVPVGGSDKEGTGDMLGLKIPKGFLVERK